MKILIATNNHEKVKEIQDILKKYDCITLKEIDKKIEVEEDGKTFEENAIKKARKIYAITKTPCIADDSGIEIETFEGWPGVLTARFLGQDKSGNEFSRQRNEYILEKMKEFKGDKRKVKYITVIAYCDENGVKVERGEIEGYIALTYKGDNGFGFDEIFELKNGKTLAQLNNKEKNKISSRKKALEKIKLVIN